MQQGHLGLEDAGFWADPLRTRDEAKERLSKEGFVGVVLDAPRRVALDDRNELPVVTTNVSTFRDNLWLDFSAAAVLAAVDLDTHAVYAKPCHDPEPPEWLTDPVPDDDVAEGTTTSFEEFDLRARLGIPWVPSRLIVRVLLADRVSAPARVDLVRTIVAYRDPAVEELVARSQRRPPLSRVSPRPGLTLPSYEARPTSPGVPDEPGIKLKAPRVQVITDAAPWVVEGSFRLPLAPHEIVPPDGSVDVGDPLAKAVVPITLVFTGSRSKFPQILHLAVPCRGTIDPGRPVGTGHFALDLRDAIRGVVDLEEETWFLYALSGEHFTGPVPSAWVDPASVGRAP